VQALRKMRVPEMTQTDLGNAMTELGFVMDKAKVSRLENGLEKRVDVNKLLALATVLEVVPDRLLRNPEELDRALYVRLRDRWVREIRESERHEALAQILIEELKWVTGRLDDAADDLDSITYDLSLTTWVLNIERPSPESEGYVDFLEKLIDGRAIVEQRFDGGTDAFFQDQVRKFNQSKKVGK
jgi:transcriptional regulator with XRE-family HTH domain